jgi:hypothetical protein
MITCKTPQAKKILAKHLAETEAPGIRVLDLATAFAQECGQLESVSYEGPQQAALVTKLKAMRDTKGNTAIAEIKRELK